MKLGGRDCTGVLPASSLSILSTAIPFLFFPLTTAGNFLVCLSVYKNPNKRLRTPFNLFIVNLAFTDFLVGLVVDPLCAAVHLVEFLTSKLPSVAGSAFHMSYYASCTASVLSLTAITIDRYIAVASPLYYRSRLSGKTVLTASAIIWIISSSLAVVYIKLGYIGYSFVFATIVILTLLVLVIGNWLIFRKLKRQLEKSRRLSEGFQNARRRASQLEARVTRGFLLVLMAYALCYVPSCAMVYIMNFCTTCSCDLIHWLRDSHFLFVLLNSCLNPFLYAWRLPAFRSAFETIIGIRQRDCMFHEPPISNPPRQKQQERDVSMHTFVRASENWVSTPGIVGSYLAKREGHCESVLGSRPPHENDVAMVKNITATSSRGTKTLAGDEEPLRMEHKCSVGLCIVTKL